MNEKIKELLSQAISDVDYIHFDNAIDKELSQMYIPDVFAEKFAKLILSDVLGCYHAIDNGNRVEGTEDFVKAVMKRYNLGKKK